MIVKENPKPAKSRGTYTPRACNFCRMRKTKCNGSKPTCESCATSGHTCTWGSESAKRPSTKQYVESLRNHTQALEAYISLLEGKIARCRQEHGGLAGDLEPPCYLYERPGSKQLTSSDSRPDFDDNSEDTDQEEDIVQQICAPTELLVLEDNDLLFHGTTSIFRFAPKAPQTLRLPEITADFQEYYVLADAGDEKYFDSNFDWSRYLPPAVPLDRREHDNVLNLLFKFFTSWCLRIVPALFLRDMYRTLSVPSSQSPPKTAHYSPMLHNALVALATGFSDDPRIRDFKSRQYFANEAKKYIEVECQKPNISVVHALSILASYHSCHGDQTLGYMYFGMSARISQAMGLNIDCSSWVKSGRITHDDMLYRNWAHWTTFSQDTCWSLYVGRDFSVTLPSDTHKIPVPFIDTDCDQLPWHYPPSKIPPQPNFLLRTFAVSCELLTIARRIPIVINNTGVPGSRNETNHELISRIDVLLNTWKERLSPEVDITVSTRSTATPHRIMLHLAYWWLFILLHRPFYRRGRSSSTLEREIDHVKLCNRAAENIVELLSTWRTLYTLRYVPITLIQVVFSAGTVFVLSAVQATFGLRVAQVSLAHSLAQAGLCINYLRETGRSWECANNIANILQDLLQEQLRPRLAMRSIEPNQYLPLRTPPSSTSEASHSTSESSATPHSSRITSCADTGNTQPLPADWNHHNGSDAGNHTLTALERQWVVDDAPVNAPNSCSFNMGFLGMDFGFQSMDLGMLGGETLPNHPYMNFGVPSAEGFGYGIDGYSHLQNGSDFYMNGPGTVPQPPLELTDAEFVLLQEFLNQNVST